LQKKFENVNERILSLAIESAKYDEERAEQILKFMVEDEKKGRGSC